MSLGVKHTREFSCMHIKVYICLSVEVCECKCVSHEISSHLGEATRPKPKGGVTMAAMAVGNGR